LLVNGYIGEAKILFFPTTITDKSSPKSEGKTNVQLLDGSRIAVSVRE
jgi:hypothetical protein